MVVARGLLIIGMLTLALALDSRAQEIRPASTSRHGITPTPTMEKEDMGEILNDVMGEVLLQKRACELKDDPNLYFAHPCHSRSLQRGEDGHDIPGLNFAAGDDVNRQGPRGESTFRRGYPLLRGSCHNVCHHFVSVEPVNEQQK